LFSIDLLLLLLLLLFDIGVIVVTIFVIVVIIQWFFISVFTNLVFIYFTYLFNIFWWFPSCINSKIINSYGF